MEEDAVRHNAGIATIFLGCAAALLAPQAGAQTTYPAKPIRMISMHTGVADAYTRLLTGKMSESMGQTVVVDPLLGAGGAS